MVTINVLDFDIRICEADYVWRIFADYHPILSGQADSVPNARKQALAAFEKYLDKAKAALEKVKKTEYETGPLHVFRWFLDSPFKGIVHAKEKHYYYNYSVGEGDWIFPEQRIVMSDDAFQKLFKRV